MTRAVRTYVTSKGFIYTEAAFKALPVQPPAICITVPDVPEGASDKLVADQLAQDWFPYEDCLIPWVEIDPAMLNARDELFMYLYRGGTIQ